jgi:hypothetical protein
MSEEWSETRRLITHIAHLQGGITHGNHHARQGEVNNLDLVGGLPGMNDDNHYFVPNTIKNALWSRIIASLFEFLEYKGIIASNFIEALEQCRVRDRLSDEVVRSLLRLYFFPECRCHRAPGVRYPEYDSSGLMKELEKSLLRRNNDVR